MRALALLVAALATAGCVSQPQGPASLPSVENAGKEPRGGHVDVRWVAADRREYGVKGELIAVDADRLFVRADAGLIAIPLGRIRRAVLHGWKAQTSEINGGATLGALSTLTHGFFLVLSMPVWALVGGVASSNEASAARQTDPAGFAKFARFPPGLPYLGGSQLARLPRFGTWSAELLQRMRASSGALGAGAGAGAAPKPVVEPATAELLSATVREQIRKAAACGTGADLLLWCGLADGWVLGTAPVANPGRYLGLRVVVLPGTSWNQALATASPALLELGPEGLRVLAAAGDPGLPDELTEQLLGGPASPHAAAFVVAAAAALAAEPARPLTRSAKLTVIPGGELRSADGRLLLVLGEGGALTLWIFSATPLAGG